MNQQQNQNSHADGQSSLTDVFDTDSESEEERYLWAMIKDLQNRYETAARPYFEQLARLRSLRTPRPVIVTAADVPEWLKQQVTNAD